MTTVMTRWREGGLAPFDWTNLSWFPLLAPSIRIEDYVEADRYVVKAELPGIDPAKDVKITYLEGALRLEVTRTEQHKEPVRTEFHYGTFVRTVTLPAAVVTALAEHLGQLHRAATGCLRVPQQPGQASSA